ncbi:MAG: hypothetical protein K0S55_2190, partial [Clostridia bacterium]|nr:hypothetical protein [Clostridia bacterium]
YKAIDMAQIGLIENIRTENPPFVVSKITFDKVEQKLNITLKNKSDKIVAGKLYFDTNQEIKGITDVKINFDINANEEKSYYLNIAQSFSSNLQIEVRSTTAGIRPSRIMLKIMK